MMKTRWNHFVMLLAGGLTLSALSARANFEVSAGINIQAAADFNTPLASEGAWIEVGSYGRCWRPNGVAVGWRPYCSGEWVWTDCGWYWQSDEPWAWACYHYGNWAFEPSVGWVWVPGVEWAPAWVCWRTGPGYIGWAPLGPRGAVFAGPQFVFVENSHFGGPIRPNNVIVNNTTIINNTRVVNNVRQTTKVVGGTKRTVVMNEGPGLAAVQKASGRTFQPVAIQEAAQRARVPASVTHQATVERKENVKMAPQTGKVNEPIPQPAENRNVQPNTVHNNPPVVTQEPKTTQEPKNTVHPARPGDNREPTTRWWTRPNYPQSPKPAPEPRVPPGPPSAGPGKSPIEPGAAPKMPENQGPPPNAPEHREGHEPK